MSTQTSTMLCHGSLTNFTTRHQATTTESIKAEESSTSNGEHYKTSFTSAYIKRRLRYSKRVKTRSRPTAPQNRLLLSSGMPAHRVVAARAPRPNSATSVICTSSPSTQFTSQNVRRTGSESRAVPRHPSVFQSPFFVA
jgi:hypothetical protein